MMFARLVIAHCLAAAAALGAYQSAWAQQAPAEAWVTNSGAVSLTSEINGVRVSGQNDISWSWSARGTSASNTIRSIGPEGASSVDVGMPTHSTNSGSVSTTITIKNYSEPKPGHGGNSNMSVSAAGVVTAYTAGQPSK